ncbi:dihydropteroate synthase [Halobacteriovorax sp. HLS]|uniref:dihydropteroate synthase n=1 Tax=Halobacteriovorax sp. HLS TaxID=2234000 RepID=UPI0013E37657|nr:dihydropteroate synthase [Halobacteriovorax sp. HLS]
MINITPNSFSDGGKFLGREEVLNQLKVLKNQGVRIFDFGAESTAPFNDPISSELEWTRLAPILESVLDSQALDQREDSISIDTYKFDVFKQAYELIRKKGSSFKVIWNDVSGKLEDEVIEFLKEHDFKLVISHNLCPDRIRTSSHMDFTCEHIDLVNYFSCYEQKLKSHDLLSKVIFDPCFGFSKTVEQNYELLSSMQKWLDPRFQWILGVSRKSFLQKLCSSDDKAQRTQQSEYLHTLLISRWMKTFKTENILIRLHDPAVFNSASLV